VLAYNKLKNEVVRSKISFSGNSLIVRLPSALAKALGLEKGGPLEIMLEGPDKISIRVLQTA
jgi:antitoxin component of MazEF toxin-antitoxin module